MWVKSCTFFMEISLYVSHSRIKGALCLVWERESSTLCRTWHTAKRWWSDGQRGTDYHRGVSPASPSSSQPIAKQVPSSSTEWQGAVVLASSASQCRHSAQLGSQVRGPEVKPVPPCSIWTESSGEPTNDGCPLQLPSGLALGHGRLNSWPASARLDVTTLARY